MEKLSIQYFKVEVANKIFDKLCNFYDQSIVNNWKSKVTKDINDIFEKYEVVKFSLNENSYMGIVIDCVSLNYGDIYIKIVPPMINRFITEVEVLNLLSKELTCKIYEIDKEKSAIIMEKIVPGKISEFIGNEDRYKELFKKMYNCKINLNERLNKNFKNFSEVVDHDYNLCISSGNSNELVDILYKKFKNIYSEVCKDETLYLLHGDIYKNNVLLSLEGLKIIDPLGFKAPFVMECVSICSYEMFYNGNPRDNLEKFTYFFKDYASEEKYKKALFCQLVKVYIPSLYEANDGGVRAGKWLSFINELYPDYIRKGDKYE